MRQAGFGLLVAAALLAPLPGAARAQEADQAGERLLSVVGEGIVRARPDMAVIMLAVVTEAKEARGALSQNSAGMNRLIDALKAKRIEARDLQTSGFSVEPRYTQPPQNQDGEKPFTPEIIGYTVRNELIVRVRELARTGEILDAAVTLGANSISGPVFTLADASAQEDLARRAAVRDALRKGALYAEAAGVTLGPIMRIDESTPAPQRPIPMAAMARETSAASTVPIQGGELTTDMQVAVSWRIAD
jgi:uncharacterized protein YggE